MNECIHTNKCKHKREPYSVNMKDHSLFLIRCFEGQPLRETITVNLLSFRHYEDNE